MPSSPRSGPARSMPRSSGSGPPAMSCSTPRQPGYGCELAILDAWDSMVPHASEVQVVGDRVRISGIVVAADCGTVVNPGLARAQFEGGSLMGLSAAIGEAVTISG